MDDKVKGQLDDLEQWVSDQKAHVRALVERLETTAGRLEKELEQQFRALVGARKAMREEARKQLRALRDEQRGLLERLRAAAKPPSKKTAAAKHPAKKTTAKNTATKRGTARTTAAKKSAAKR
jgi:peptidoglycan hydrolase CwlO-like protein